MKIHENWCLKSPGGFHCFHFIAKDDNSTPTEEVCCWCGKKRSIYYITGSTGSKPHGKYKDDYKMFSGILGGTYEEV